MTARRLRSVAGSIAVTAFVTTAFIAASCTSAEPPSPVVAPPPPAAQPGYQPPLGSMPPAPDPAPQDATQQKLSQQQLDQLVAPVALYPDALLTDVLTGATYPLEIVEVERWLSDPANAALKGDALTQALDGQNWDPSVKSLAAFPPVLQMMDGHLDWTQRLGEAFLAQEADVMDAVQRLRQRAQSAGMLKSSPQQTVTNDNGAIVIAPAAPEVVYLPAYDPWCIYGPWPYPDYPPFYFGPWSGVCGPADYLIGYDLGFFLPFWWWWGYPEWHNHRIHIDHDRYQHFHPGHEPAGGMWQHDPAHRRGVQYRDPRNATQFQSGRDYHNSFRGYAGQGGEPAPSVHPTSPAFEGFGSGADVRTQSERGYSSRSGMQGGGGGYGSGRAPGGGGGGFGGGGRGGGGGGRGGGR